MTEAKSAKKTPAKTTKSSTTAKSTTSKSSQTTKKATPAKKTASASTSPAASAKTAAKSTPARSSKAAPAKTATSSTAAKSPAARKGANPGLGVPDAREVREAIKDAPASVKARSEEVSEGAKKVLAEAQDSLAKVKTAASEELSQARRRGPAYAVLTAPRHVAVQTFRGAKATAKVLVSVTPARRFFA